MRLLYLLLPLVALSAGTCPVNRMDGNSEVVPEIAPSLGVHDTKQVWNSEGSGLECIWDA